MTRATAHYSGEELEIVFQAEASVDWIGDPTVVNGTMDEISLGDLSIGTLTILGVVVEPKALPEELQAKLLELAEEVDAWEFGE